MEPVIQTFRSALGGFNRQDVQQYLEQITADHKKEVETLQEQLDHALERKAALKGSLEAALSKLESEKDSAAASEAQLRAELEDSTRTLTKLRGEQSQTESKLAVARKELERLQARVGELEPMAESYAQLKDRIATVELDAHRKAKDTLEEARQEAERLREEAQQEAAQLREETQQEAAQLREETQQETAQLREETQQETARLREETRRWLEGMLAQYGALSQGINVLLEQVRNMGQLEEYAQALDEQAQHLREMAAQDSDTSDTIDT